MSHRKEHLLFHLPAKISVSSPSQPSKSRTTSCVVHATWIRFQVGREAVTGGSKTKEEKNRKMEFWRTEFRNRELKAGSQKHPHQRMHE
jgi:hypothetical protein